ncbi:hypothetical protein RB614_19370 [Phytohabitans sp. ZYX-F-186]|uniref:Uncharacterized protein n=1 Tax=Phytohabitans maris TaxID=3071409 RepID=A0ABU0ZI02_9ACTN|nr:hypothetical protein [Phytohabitans sp. ZYX-F-186]MDQ7906679.1 hypothetical protein [Phytohabitans sp. ZYX-F-186]
MTGPVAAPPRTPPSRRGRWLVAVAVAWAVLLGVLAYVSVRNDPPTVRDQRTIGEARPRVDRAVGELAVAAGSDAVLSISGYEVTGGCRITPMRSGETLERDVTAYTSQTDAPVLLDRIADRLPRSYQAGVRHGQEHDTLRADAGEFVSVRGGVTAPGVVILTVGTGCRPPAPLGVELPAPGDEDRRIADRMLVALGGTLDGVAVAEAPCPSGGTVRTVAASGSRSGSGKPLGDVLVPVFGSAQAGPPLVDTVERYAYRGDEAMVAVDADKDGTLDARLTTPC